MPSLAPAAPRRLAAGRCALLVCAVVGACLPLPAAAAVNSYRFMHVTINTPWYIFLFLLMGIFAPFILMVVLMWRHSLHKRQAAKPATGPGDTPQ